MDEKDINEIMALIDRVAHRIHSAALLGVSTREGWRMMGEHFDINFANTSEKRAEKAINKQGTEIIDHEVENSLIDEKKFLKSALKAVMYIYLAEYNIMKFFEAAVIHLNHFLTQVERSKKLSLKQKAEIAKKIQKIINGLVSDFDRMRNKLNAVWSKSKGGAGVALGVTKILHTSGSSVLRRRKEWIDFKNGHKEELKAAADENKLLRGHFRSEQEAEREENDLTDHLKRMEEKYTNSMSLLFVEWEEIEEYMEKEAGIITKAAADREVPQVEPKILSRIQAKILHEVTEPQLHNLQTAANQLKAKAEQLAAIDQKVAKAA